MDKYNKKQLTWNQILEVCKDYNIPKDAKIELATGWECSEVQANELFYSFETNTLFIVSGGVEYWFEKPDIIRLQIENYL